MQLTLYMLRADLDERDYGLREVWADYTQVASQPIGRLQSELWVRHSEPKPPRWLRDLLGIASREDLSPLVNTGSSALLLLKHRGHRFILAYGMGHHAVDPGVVVQGFGLRVVANAIGPGKLKGADTRGLSRRGRSQRIVIPSTVPLYELGIEPTEDLVRQLEGKPTADFASGAAGANSLKLKIRNFSLKGLEGKLDQILDFYESDAYKKTFAFLDYFVRVPRENKILGSRLESVLRSMVLHGADGVDFASPDIDAPMSTAHYELKWRRHAVELAEMEPLEVVAAISEWRVEDPLREVKVLSYDGESDQPTSRYRLLDYAVADVPLDDKRYTICAGSWYEVDYDNLRLIQRRVEEIPDITTELSLAPWDLKTQAEADYNSAVATTRGWRLLDREYFPIERPNQRVEICDILTPKKQLICVKKMRDSSTLSHLFAQGLVSANLLVSNVEGYQDKTLEYLKQIAKDATFGTRDQWTVVYAIATDKSERLADSLFFFSKVNLDRTATALRNLGVSVALAKVTVSK